MEGQTKDMSTVREWINVNFTLPACRNLAYLVARRAYCSGYNTALQDQKAFVFDGRSIVATPEARELADFHFESFLNSPAESQVK
jgi:hypothetical protein